MQAKRVPHVQKTKSSIPRVRAHCRLPGSLAVFERSLRTAAYGGLASVAIPWSKERSVFARWFEMPLRRRRVVATLGGAIAIVILVGTIAIAINPSGVGGRAGSISKHADARTRRSVRPSSAMQLAFADSYGGISTIDVYGTHLRALTSPPSGQSDAGPSWSPDGTRLVFDRRSSDPDGAGHGGDLYVVRSDGTRLRRLTRIGDVYEPVWWPPGVYFGTNNQERFLINPDGSSLRQVPPHGQFSPNGPYGQFSPNGRWFAFSSLNRPGVPGGLFVEHADGIGRRRLLSGAVSTLGWAPDSKRIALSGLDGNLYIVNVADGRMRQLTRFPPEDPLSGYGTGSPNWSPDGTRIAIDWDDNAYVVNATGGRARQRTWFEPDSGTTPAYVAGWSPDGTRITLDGPDGNVYVVNASSGPARQLTRFNIVDPALGVANFGWSPDGNWIAFAYWNPVTAAYLYVIKPDGTGRRRLTSIDPEQAVSWKP
jgi:Tol biopolymer transport system component